MNIPRTQFLLSFIFTFSLESYVITKKMDYFSQQVRQMMDIGFTVSMN
ncbi:hypothetical protein Bsph_0660 [Lysinibacillus sphaericus C3-41]|uniref:Uncharacterized protein n=1 Tax=Lysinibacillus sphaericus (strain C3-41) TaxID=444177 RepID=B1HXI5_LYSSC|nr:hypothetical protein Bsph_0660 [Lysinibacillus sphaericus C3-41]